MSSSDPPGCVPSVTTPGQPALVAPHNANNVSFNSNHSGSNFLSASPSQTQVQPLRRVSSFCGENSQQPLRSPMSVHSDGSRPIATASTTRSGAQPFSRYSGTGTPGSPTSTLAGQVSFSRSGMAQSTRSRRAAVAGPVPGHHSDDDSDHSSEHSGHSLALSADGENDDDGEDGASKGACAQVGKRLRALLKKPRKAPALDSDAFFVFSGNGVLRILIYNVVHTRLFEGLVILVILLNSVMLALDDPTTTVEPDYVTKMEYFFIVAFSLEALLKIFAFGFVGHKGAYLRNPWNFIDFIIVLLSYAALYPGFGNYTAFRTLRVLRPLRSMNAIPPLKTIVQGLLYSIKGLFNVMLLMGFIFTIFGILAVQLWMGELQRRCVNDVSGDVLDLSYCAQLTPDETLGGLRGRSCPGGYTCVADVENPNYGFTNFDNVLWAFLVIIQVITLEGWGLIMFATMDAWGWPACIYFITLILIGSYFVLNLALAVINSEFMEAKNRIQKEQVDMLAEERLVQARAEMQLQAANRRASVAGGQRAQVDLMQEESQLVELEKAANGVDHMKDDCSSVYSSDLEDEGLESTLGGSTRSPKYPTMRRPTTVGGVMMGGRRLKNPTAFRKCVRSTPIRKIRRLLFGIVEGDPSLYGDNAQETTLFTKCIIFCIFINTVVLAAEHHGQSAEQDQVAHYSNLVFTTIFGVEFVMKIIALNPVRYVQDGFNVLDGVIVIVSFVELALGGTGTFTVLRAFRLLRVFKLLKNFPSLRSIVEVMLLAIRDTGYLNIIILLYLFIASLIGMQLFGGEMKKIEQLDPEVGVQRSTFDSFPWAFYTVFQILTRDSWPDLMWTAMKTTNEGASIYFLFCVVTGDFIILNLFLAILISSFDRAGDTTAKLDDGEVGIVLTDGRETKSKKSGMMLNKGGLGSFLGKPNVHDKTTSRVFGPPAEGSVIATSPISPKNPKPQGLLFQASDDQAALDSPALSEPPPLGGLGLNTSNLMSPTDSGLFSQGDIDGVNEAPVCPDCESVMQMPFETASKAINKKTPEDLHERMCELVIRRKIKEAAIAHLVQEFCGADELDEAEGFGINDETEIHGKREDSSNAADSPTSFRLHLPGDPPKAGNAWFLGANRNGYSPLVHANKSKPTPQRVEEAFGTAWEVGLLLSEDVEQYLNMKTWSPFRKLLVEEQRVLDLKVGEEQIGRGLVAYTHANIPSEMVTNGGTSLWIFGPRNAFRAVLTQIIANPWFDRIILLIIMLSSIVMALDNPREEGTEYNNILVYLNYSFVTIFFFEAVIKIIALGFAFHPTAYLREGWNVLDFGIVVVSLVSVILRVIGQSGFEFIQVLRTFRALRPLRVINRNRGLKMVVQTLLLSIKGIANVALITMIIYSVFSILGVQLFAGQQYECNDDAIRVHVNCTGTFLTTQEEFVYNTTTGQVIGTAEIVVNRTREWATQDFNFDNMYNSFLTLFVVATLDDWSDVMYSVIDSTGTHTAPELNTHPEYGIFFIVFIIMGSFFLLNMFVGVIIFNFNQVKSQMDGLSMLSDEQKLWVETQRMMLNYKPSVKQKPGKHPLRQWCWRVVLNPWFELLTAVMIFLNITFIAINHYQQGAVFDYVDTWSNYFFVAVFALEAVLKLTAFLQRYFFDGWNRFDMFLVLISFVEIGLQGQIGFRFGVLRVFRIFRIARMLSLVKKAKNVRILLETLWFSLPSLANIGAFLLLLFFVFTVLGVQLFALVKRRNGLDHHLNFENFPNTFLLLVQVATLDNWGGVLIAVSDDKDCGPSTNPQGWNDCGTPFAPIYFFAFIIFAGFVMVNLFVAIILDNFSTTMKLDKSRLTVADLKKFADAWSNFDEDASWLMDTSNFPLVLSLLKPPLGIARRADRVALLRLTTQYSIPEHAGKLHFAETLIPLARKVQGVQFSDADIREHEEVWKQQFPELNSMALLRYRQKRCTVDQYLAAAYIQAAFRRRRAIRQIEEMWNDRYGRISDAYDKLGIPEDSRVVLHKMERSKEERWQQHLAREELAAEYVQRDRAKSISLLEADAPLVGPKVVKSNNFINSPSQGGNPNPLGGGGGGKQGTGWNSTSPQKKSNNSEDEGPGSGNANVRGGHESLCGDLRVMSLSTDLEGGPDIRRQSPKAQGSDDSHFGLLVGNRGKGATEETTQNLEENRKRSARSSNT